MPSQHTFAARHKLRVVPTEPEFIGLLGRNRAESVGRVSACFRFQGEEQGYWQEFHVLRKSVCDVVLGKHFLAETETLTKFARRILERVRLCLRRHDCLFLLDESPRDLIRCTVNGAEAAAFPDTGSDLMIVSQAFAQRNDFPILTGEEYVREVQLIDGSTVWTSGMVFGAKLGFDVSSGDMESLEQNEYLNFAAGLASSKGGEVHEVDKTIFVCDLHVIDNIPFNIILSGDFIFKNKVFGNFQHLFAASAAGADGLKDDVPEEQRLLFVRRRARRWLSRSSGRERGNPSKLPTGPRRGLEDVRR
jgi:hypothetical protein